MPTIEEILRAAKEAGASDVHLTVGIPPKMRVNGNLITMDYPRMLPADTLEVLVNIMTEVQRECLIRQKIYSAPFTALRKTAIYPVLWKPVMMTFLFPFPVFPDFVSMPTSREVPWLWRSDW